MVLSLTLRRKRAKLSIPHHLARYSIVVVCCGSDIAFQVLWVVLRRKDSSKNRRLVLLLQLVPVTLLPCLLTTQVRPILRCKCTYIWWLNIDCPVPIYDATGGTFQFSESDLSNIRTLPLFRKGAHDLPPYAVVTVGYTVTSFVTSNSASANTAFLFNVLFVIVLAEKIKDDEDQ